MSRKRRFGAGFIAVISGIELTNVVIYFVVGEKFGILSPLLIAALFIPAIYMQQVITIPKLIYSKTFREVLSSQNYFMKNLYELAIYMSSGIILLVNVIAISLILSLVLGGKWFPYTLIVLLISYLLVSGRKAGKFVEKILMLLSLCLLVYVLALIMLIVDDFPSIFNQQLNHSFVLDFALLTALWGAVASPYSLILQEEADELEELWIAYFFGVAISASISLYAFFAGIRSVDIRALFEISLLGKISSYAIVAGLLATVILSSSSIITTISSILGRDKTVFTSKYRESLIIVLSIIAGFFILSTLVLLTSTNIFNSIIKLTIYASIFIGILTTLTLVPILYCFYRLWSSSRIKVFLVNIIGISTILVGTSVVALLGLLELFS